MVTECNTATAESRVRISTGRFLSGALNVTSRRHLDSRCTPVLLAVPDVEFPAADGIACIALHVPGFLFLTRCRRIFSFERDADDDRSMDHWTNVS